MKGIFGFEVCVMHIFKVSVNEYLHVFIPDNLIA